MLTAAGDEHPEEFVWDQTVLLWPDVSQASSVLALSLDLLQLENPACRGQDLDLPEVKATMH